MPSPVVAVVLVGLGLAGFVTGSALDPPPPRVVGANAPLNPGATDLGDVSANNSPSLQRNPVDPANLAVANRVDSPRYSCALHVSRDGGAMWAPVPIPFPSGEELPPRCFAPDIAFGADGTLYVAFATLEGPGNVPSAVWTSSSPDGGRTLSPPARALGPLAFQARISADPRHARRLYLSWLQAEETAYLALPTVGNPILVARSDDGGRTWEGPVRVSSQGRPRVVVPSLAVSEAGEVFVLYLDVGGDSLDYHGAHEGKGGEPYPGRWSLVLARSADRGATWNESVVDDAVVPTERFIVFLPPAPSLAIDPGGEAVYVAFQDGRGGDADVWLWASTDGGRRFAAARRVNDTRPRDGTSQYLPRLAVAPGGRLDAVYYDRRADRANLHNEVSLQSSTDHGKTFGPRLRLSDRSFDSRIGFGSERGMPDLGSRLGLVSSDRRALAVWTDTRGGAQIASKQDLARAVVAFPQASPLRLPLRGAGLTLVAVGLFSWAWPALRSPWWDDALVSQS